MHSRENSHPNQVQPATGAMTLRLRAQMSGQVTTTQDQNQPPADDDLVYGLFSESVHSGEEIIPGMDGDFEEVATTPLNPPRASGGRRDFRLGSPWNETPERNGRRGEPLDRVIQRGRVTAMKPYAPSE